MMTDDRRPIKMFCDKCKQNTNHNIRYSHHVCRRCREPFEPSFETFLHCCKDCKKELEWIANCGLRSHNYDEDPPGVTDYYILGCGGCNNVCFAKHWRNRGDGEWIEYEAPPLGEAWVPILHKEIYPPVSDRQQPPWFEDLRDVHLKKISNEIYIALQSQSYILATIGSRTLIDRLIFLTVGHKDNFPDGLKAMQAQGKFTLHDCKILEPVVKAGHASAHRGWAASKEQIYSILDIIEGLIYRLQVSPALSEGIEKSVPERNGRT